jgi:hypothetical protein
MRALIVFIAALPTVLYASDAEVIQPSCAHPADLQERPPGHGGFPGDHIVFTRGTDSGTGVMTLQERYHFEAYAPVKWKGLDAVRVVLPVLTLAQIAELRCESVVDLVVRDLEPRARPSPQDRPYTKVRLGIAIRPVGDAEAGGRLRRGVAVTSVGQESVASRAGLLAKDYILKFAGHDINSMEDLLNLMVDMNPGDAVSMGILRNGNEISVTAQF